MYKFISTLVIILSLSISSTAFASSKKIKMSDLHRAAFYNDVSQIEELLSDKSTDINARATNEVTPLHMAAHEGNLDAVRILVKNGADPDLRNKMLETALDVAIRKGKADVADYLFSITKTDKKNTQSSPIPEKTSK